MNIEETKKQIYTRLNNVKSYRNIDKNGYLFVEKSPILKSGIFEYKGYELGKDVIDGIKIDKEKVYKVYIPVEELEKSKDTFALLPIINDLINDHDWLGTGWSDCKDSKDLQEGSTGEKVYVEDGYLYVSLKFTSPDTIKMIMNGEREELSAGYMDKSKKSNSKEYDFICYDIIGNHVALVDRGRCGSDVRVYNRAYNSFKNFINNNVKEKNMQEEIKKEDVLKDKECLSKNDFEKREDDEKKDFSKLEEKLDRIISLLGERTENMCNKEIDKKNMEDKKEIKEDTIRTKNSSIAGDIYLKIKEDIYKEISEKFKKENETRIRTYNSLKEITGEFDYSNLNERDMYITACNSIGFDIKDESIEEMKGIIRACNSKRVDESYNYNDNTTTSSEVDSYNKKTIEFNI